MRVLTSTVFAAALALAFGIPQANPIRRRNP
jgi:hypothetical protein